MTAILEQQAPPQDTVPTPPTPVAVPAPVVSAPAPAPAPERPGRLRSLLSAQPKLTPTGVRLIGAATLAMIIVSDLLQPAADGPKPVYPVWLEALYTVQFAGLLAGAVGFVMGRRWALKAAVLVSGIGGFNVAMCPVTGHHVLAAWWFGEVVLAAALLALPALVLRRTRRGR